MCAYRSLFTFIDYKLLQKSLSEMKHFSFDIQADGSGGADQPQEIEYNITAYNEKFAEDFCRNLKVDFQGQLAFIEQLQSATETETTLQPFVDQCASTYTSINLFLPKMQGLTQDTYLFTTQELCVIFAQAITEIKEGEIILPVVDANKKAREEPYGIMDFTKALQIVAHELYLEKQHQNMRYNCYNSSFLKNK